MRRFRARVENGRIVIDAPTTLPEGLVLDLVVDDEGDDLTDEEREALHAALRKSSTSKTSRPAADVVRDLRPDR